MNLMTMSPEEQSCADILGYIVNILVLITSGLVCVSLLHCEEGEKVYYGWNVEFDLEKAYCVAFTGKSVLLVQAGYWNFTQKIAGTVGSLFSPNIFQVYDQNSNNNVFLVHYILCKGGCISL